MPRRVPRALAPLLALLTTALATTAVVAPSAGASWRAPCVPPSERPTCSFWAARVTSVADGDTIRVRVADDPGRVRTIRFTGINAMEMTRYSSSPRRRRGACHALAATALVDRAVRQSGRTVWLSAQRASSHSGVRLRRSVWARVDGRRQDLSRMQLERGLALWLPNGREYAHNLEYRLLAQQAAHAGLGLYDPRACGAGPDEDVPLHVTVNWDADGNDRRRLNGEWIQVANRGARDLSLRGWWVRDSWLSYGGHRVPGYAFPASARVPAGGSVRVHVGCGRDTATSFHWCRRTSAFENVTHDTRQMGDGAYLFDPDGDLRSSMIYPCAAPCGDPLQGAVRLSVDPTTPEWIGVTNVSGGVVDLQGYLLKLHLRGRADKFIWSRPFGATPLAPGETLRLWLQGRHDDSRLVRHLGMRAFVLADGGNVVSIQTYADALVACVAWGRSSC
jgi:endonuclease YncB( thermonuclease family)